MSDKLKKLLTVITNPFLGFILFLTGSVWFILLSNKELNFGTYISENALLVGLIKNRFTDNIVLENIYHKFNNLKDDNEKVFDRIRSEFLDSDIDFGIQNFTFKYSKLFPNQEFKGQNIYGIVRSPGSPGLQSVLITAPLRGSNNKALVGSISTLIALAKHSRSALYWGVDLIFLFTDMEFVGLKAFINSYHGVDDPNSPIKADELNPRSGSILAGFNVEIDSYIFNHIELKLESLNGRQPNLDLFNSVVRLASKSYIPTYINGKKALIHRVLQNHLPIESRNLLTMMWNMASGSPSGLHGLLNQYQIPALTLTTNSLTPQQAQSSRFVFNLFSAVELIESTIRCLNNLQERMHQSFFFYLLSDTNRYISIGVYMIPFAVLCVGALAHLVFQGTMRIVSHSLNFSQSIKSTSTGDSKQDSDVYLSSVDFTLVAKSLIHLLILGFGLGLLCTLGLDLFIIRSRDFNVNASIALVGALAVFSAGVIFLTRINIELTQQSLEVIRSIVAEFLLLFLGILSIINISMAYFVAIVIIPLAILARPYHNRLIRSLVSIYVMLTSPICVMLIASGLHLTLFSTINELSKRHQLSDLVQSLLDKSGHWLVQMLVERDVLGSWTCNIITMGYIPFWIMFVCLCHFKLPKDQSKTAIQSEILTNN